MAAPRGWWHLLEDTWAMRAGSSSVSSVPSSYLLFMAHQASVMRLAKRSGFLAFLPPTKGRSLVCGSRSCLQPVDNTSADAGVVDDEGVDPVPVAVGLQELGGAHGVAPAHPPDDPGDRALAPDDDGLRLSEAGYVARDDDVSRWLEAPLGCAGRVAEGDDGVVEVVGEPAEHAADVQGSFRPHSALRSATCSGATMPGTGSRVTLGVSPCADPDSVVHVPLRVVGVVERVRPTRGGCRS